MEKVREKMVESARLYGMGHNKTILLSQELDKYIIAFLKEEKVSKSDNS